MLKETATQHAVASRIHTTIPASRAFAERHAIQMMIATMETRAQLTLAIQDAVVNTITCQDAETEQ